MSDSYSPTDRLTLLGAVYQAERADNAAIFTNTLAILGFAIAYVVAVLGFVSTAATLHGVLLAFTPTPACALVAYHQVMVGMNGARAASAHRLEKRIGQILGSPELPLHIKRDQRSSLTLPKQVNEDPTFGIIVGEQFLDPTVASRVRALGSGLTYVTLFAATAGFSVFMLIRAYQHNSGVLALVCGAVLAGIGLAAAGWNLWLNGRRPEVKSVAAP